MFADYQITGVKDFGNDVDPVFELKIDKVGLLVFDFVNGGSFIRSRLDICKSVVVINRRNQERCSAGLLVEVIAEVEFCQIGTLELCGLSLCSFLTVLQILRNLTAKLLYFVL